MHFHQLEMEVKTCTNIVIIYLTKSTQNTCIYLHISLFMYVHLLDKSSKPLYNHDIEIKGGCSIPD